jgi:hypothetical protein
VLTRAISTLIQTPTEEADMKQVLGVHVRPTVVKEPVMNVPAIDMTDAATRAKRTSSPARKKHAKPAASSRKRPGRAAQTKAQPKRTSDGSVGRETFERVEALVKQGKSKSEAFQQVGADTGRNVGTVSANYYRVARAAGALKSRKRKARASAVSTRRAPTGRGVRPARSGSVDAITADLVRNVQALAKAVQDQEREVTQLRGRLNAVRSLVS